MSHFQRCSRRAFLDFYGDASQQEPPSDYLLKLLRDSANHRQRVLATRSGQQPHYPLGDWAAGASLTYQMMQEGVECIQQGVLMAQYSEAVTLLSCPDLLIKQPGSSKLGDWCYVPIAVKLGKRPKLEYQVSVVFDAYVLSTVQVASLDQAWLMLRERGLCSVDVLSVLPQMQDVLTNCVQTLTSSQAPDVFIARNRCNLCPWFNHCYTIAQEQQHLSLVAGITPHRYSILQALDLTTVEALAHTPPSVLEPLAGFGKDVAEKLVLQARSNLTQQALLRSVIPPDMATDIPTCKVELYFDIEADPDMTLDYLLGVLVVNHETQCEQFHSFLAETPEAEYQIWTMFVDLVEQYPDAPIFHFCPYETHTIKRLAALYDTPPAVVKRTIDRCVDLHEQVTRRVILPIESYALKNIARWLGFNWRDPNATGAQAVCWYTQWLETGDRAYLEAIVTYNEDDCRAMYYLKNWLVSFFAQATQITPQNLQNPLLRV
ncbi:MAG: TM0106 family RecB-like putative nuclease [Cyanobacteriota bacterium SKYGB_h_bin112]|nr:TM0106 family RecB-like putative nuclease [Cyanobacteriota bacterium SKYGB_h_bin112]